MAAQEADWVLTAGHSCRRRDTRRHSFARCRGISACWASGTARAPRKGKSSARARRHHRAPRPHDDLSQVDGLPR
eukprot:10190208-Alexandrium_andersonii.AAC.1